MTGSRSSTQPGGEQTAGVAFEDQQRVIQVLAVATVEEAQLLLPMSRVVGGVDIEEDLAAFSHLFTTDADEPIQQNILQTDDLASRRRVLPTAERRLRAQSLAQRLISQNLESGIMAQAIGVVRVFIARDDLIDALAEERQYRMMDPFIFTKVTHALRQNDSESMTLVESAKGQKAGVTADLPAAKIHMDGLGTVEREIKLCYTSCQFADAPKGNAGFVKTKCSSTF